MNPASSTNCASRCSRKNPDAEITSTAKLPPHNTAHARKVVPKASIDCMAWNRTAGRSRSMSHTTPPLTHHAR